MTGQKKNQANTNVDRNLHIASTLLKVNIPLYSKYLSSFSYPKLFYAMNTVYMKLNLNSVIFIRYLKM